MMDWKTTKLGELLRHRKGSITIDDATSYKLCRVQLHRRGVVLRQRLRGAEIRTKSQQVCKAGDFLVAEMDAKVGGYGFVPPELDGAIVSSHYFLFEVDQTKLLPAYLEVLSQALILQQQIVAKGSTNYSAIRPSAVLGWQIPLPEMSVQKRIAANFETIQSKLALANNEITRQQSLIATLKQAILQEAIQGKLTADWRAAHLDVEPVSKLLQRIQVEKARLIAAKKLRPEKPLPKITSDEIPFEIPKGWEWCRLDDFLNVRAGIAKGGKRYAGSTTPTPYLRVANVQRGYLDLAEIKYLDLPAGEVKKYALEDGDLLVTEGGDPDKVGRCAVWRAEVEGCVHQNHIFSMRPYANLSLELEVVPLMLNSPFCRTHFLGAYKQTTNLASINKTVLRSTPIPLPPLAEQKAIVEKVEALMATCRALEAEIEHSRTHAANLLQAVLREAFSGKPAAQDANDKPIPATAKVIPFPARNLTRIANISPTDLQAGIIAMAYRRHEQIPKYLQYFHHVKAEKIIHLVEAHLGIDLERMPMKAAAGPNDYPHLKKVESRARKANWFDVRQAKTGGAHTYYKKSSFDALLDKTAAALGERAAEVDALINLLLPLNTRQAEIVATLYAAWNNLLLLGRLPSDEEIVYEARENWHSSKLEIEREKFFRGLEWMRKQGLIAAGRGRYVDAK